MRVLYVADQYSDGGAADALIEMIIYLREKYNVEPVVVTAYNNALSDRLNQYGIEFYCLGYRQFAYNMSGVWYKESFLGRILYSARYFIANWKAKKRAENLIDFSKIDLIHSNVDRNDIGGIFSRKYSIPHVWHLRELSRGHFRLAFNRVRPFKYMNKLTDRFIAISETVKNDWEDRGLEGSKINVIYDGVDVESYTFKDALISDKSLASPEKVTLKMVCVGAITPQKGQEELIRALAIAERNRVNFELDLYGRGQEAYITSLKTAAQEYGIDNRIKFCGYNKDLTNILMQYDVGVNPSTGEGFGRVTIEYMAAGLLAIVHRAGVGSEIISDGIDGYLYDKEKDLADIIISIYQEKQRLWNAYSCAEEYDEKLRNSDMIRMSQAGRKKVYSDFDIRNYVEHIYSLYLGCAKGSKRG